MSLRDFLNEMKEGGWRRGVKNFGEDTAATLRGITMGGTFGTAKYPAAGLMALTYKIFNDTNLSFEDAYKVALETVNEQQKTDRQRIPTARGVAEVASALPSGQIALQGARTLPQVIARTGTVGAAAGYNEAQRLEDAGTGAGFGVLAGGAGQLVEKAGRAGGRFLDKAQENIIRGGKIKSLEDHSERLGSKVNQTLNNLNTVRQSITTGAKSRTPDAKMAALFEEEDLLIGKLAQLQSKKEATEALLERLPSESISSIIKLTKPKLGEGGTLIPGFRQGPDLRSAWDDLTTGDLYSIVGNVPKAKMKAISAATTMVPMSVLQNTGDQLANFMKLSPSITGPALGAPVTAEAIFRSRQPVIPQATVNEWDQYFDEDLVTKPTPNAPAAKKVEEWDKYFD